MLLAAALTSHQLGHGHVCLDLEATLGAPDAALSLPPEGDEGRDVLLPSQLLRGVRLDAWREALAASSLVEVVDERPGDPEPSETATSPLVLCAQRLYLRRYWRHELEIALALRERLGRQAPWPQTWRRAWPRCSRRRRRKTASASPTGRSWPVPWRPAAISA